MPLYEIKLRLTPEESKELIHKLGLVFQKESCDTDYYFTPAPDKPKMKLKLYNGKTRLDEVTRDNALFIMKGREILEPEEQQALQKVAPVIQLERRKEIYKWPAQKIEIAFDFIEGLASTVFFEVYSHKRQSVLEAKKALEALGLKNFLTKTYDEVFKEKK